MKKDKINNTVEEINNIENEIDETISILDFDTDGQQDDSKQIYQNIKNKKEK
ncbi:hypothetical protein [Spiroplasma endosymbiont of Aspidapion aeneum]|uniref:hypothetical protein n=1 Tax=Spiroplasma endosymbiont of Aspidapion aeneum TaxID=3066276 RepID=UPI00313DACD3